MIRKSGPRFSERSCSNKKIERDDDSKKSHPALALHDSTGRACITASGFGPHRVRTTLAQESTPSTTIVDAASEKKLAAVACCVDSHHPPMPMNNSRALCASTGPAIFAAPCEEKYIDIAKPMKAYIGAAVERYCRLAARTPASPVKMLTQMSGKTAMMLASAPTEKNAIRPAVQAMRRARAIRFAPIAIPIIGTEAMPTENEIDVSMNSSRAPMP